MFVVVELPVWLWSDSTTRNSQFESRKLIYSL